MKFLIGTICLILCLSTAEAQTQKKPTKKRSTVKSIVPNWKPGLRGSKPSQIRQNKIADQEDLSRIPDAAALKRMIKAGYLVKIPTSKTLVIDGRLPHERHYVRPWTKKFLVERSKRFYKKFNKPWRINSGVRTIKGQIALQDRNGNAAAATGPTASSHPTGSTVDIARIGLTGEEDEWLGKDLLDLETCKCIEATKERQQKVFHVMVSKMYPKWCGDKKETKPKSSTKKSSPQKSKSRKAQATHHTRTMGGFLVYIFNL